MNEDELYQSLLKQFEGIELNKRARDEIKCHVRDLINSGLPVKSVKVKLEDGQPNVEFRLSVVSCDKFNGTCEER